MNASVVSVNTAVANVSTAWATIRFMTLGRMWRRMIQPRPTPMTRARSTNIRSLIDRTWLRMTRAVVAQLVRPMTIDDDEQRRPDAEQLRLGADDVEDDRREDEREHDRRQDEEEVRQAHQAACPRAPPTKPATMPTSAPMTIVMSVAMSPIAIEIRAPWTVRLSMSRPELVGAEEVLGARRLERDAGRGREVLERADEQRRERSRAAPKTTRIARPTSAVGPAERAAPRTPPRPARSDARCAAGRPLGAGDAGVDAHARTRGSRKP